MPNAPSKQRKSTKKRGQPKKGQQAKITMQATVPVPKQRRQSPVPQNAVVLAKQNVATFTASKDASAAVKDMLLQTLVCNHAFRAPVVSAAETGITRATGQFSVQPNPSGYGALFITNNPRVPILSLAQSADPITFTSPLTFLSFANEQRCCITPFDLTSGSHQLNWHGEPNDSFVVVDSNGQMTAEVIFYSLNLTSVSYTFKNVSGTNDTFVLSVYKRDMSGDAWNLVQASNTGDLANNATFAFDMTSNPSPGFGDYAFSVTTVSGTLRNFNHYGWEITQGEGYAWQPIPFLGSVPGTKLQRDYLDTSTKHRILACDATLSNFSAKLYRNGMLEVCRIRPKEFRKIAPDPATILSYIATNATTKKRIQMQLSSGCHVPFLPPSVNYLEFKDTQPKNISYRELNIDEATGTLVVWESNDSAEQLPVLKLWFQMNLEVQSNDQILPSARNPHCFEILSDWYQFLETVPIYSENPKHITNAVRRVTAFMKDKNNQEKIQKAGDMLLTGLKVATPLVLSLL